MRMIPLGPLKRTHPSSGTLPVPPVRLRCVAAPYHAPRALFAELANRRPSMQRFTGHPTQPLAIFNAPLISMPPSILDMPLTTLALRLSDYATQTCIEDIGTDMEHAAGPVLTSGTDTDVEMYDVMQLDDMSIMDVEIEKLDTKPDIALNEITTGIADLYHDEVDKLAAQLAGLTLNNKWPRECFVSDVDMVGMSIDPPTFKGSIWAPPLLMTEPSVWQVDRVSFTPNLADVIMADVDDLDCDTQPTVMMDDDEWSPSDGFTNDLMDTTEWPSTTMHEVYDEARNYLLSMDAAAVSDA